MYTLSRYQHRAVGRPRDEALQTGEIGQINSDCPYLFKENERENDIYSAALCLLDDFRRQTIVGNPGAER